MQYELVDFYPINEKNRGNLKQDVLGTVHIYVVDCHLDFRGIRVTQKGSAIFFQVPHIFSKDMTGKNVKYPVFKWTDQKDHEAMMNFLHNDVKPIIKKRIKHQM